MVIQFLPIPTSPQGNCGYYCTGNPEDKCKKAATTLVLSNAHGPPPTCHGPRIHGSFTSRPPSPSSSRTTPSRAISRTILASRVLGVSRVAATSRRSPSCSRMPSGWSAAASADAANPTSQVTARHPSS
jgi:hypothetical protein